MFSSQRDRSHSFARLYLFAIPFAAASAVARWTNTITTLSLSLCRTSALATNKTLFNNWAIFKLFMWNTLKRSVLLMRCNAEFSMWQSEWWLESKQRSAAQLKNKCIGVYVHANWYRSMWADCRFRRGLIWYTSNAQWFSPPLGDRCIAQCQCQLHRTFKK